MNVQQHSIRCGMVLWASGLVAVMESALAGIGGMVFHVFSALCLLSSVLCSVWYGCLVYGAFVAAVVAMVSVVAWACSGYSFLAFLGGG